MPGQADVLERLIKPVVEGLGYEFVGIEHVAHQPGALLRVYIDSGRGVSVDDCALVSHQLSGVLDVEDPISGAYTLEVSSPGFDRPLFSREHYERFRGSRVHVRLARPIDGRRNFTGDLLGMAEDMVIVRCDGEDFHLPYPAIEQGRIVPTQ